MARKWCVGDAGWEVEWCKELPCYPDDPDTIDRDNAVMVTRCFDSREEAYRYAKEVYPRDQFGAVAITPFSIEPLSDEWPYGAYREYTADSETYEGED